LEQNNFHRVESLIKNTDHESSIKALIAGNAPGEIYVDDLMNPMSALLLSPECNLIVGDANNKVFNNEIKDKLDFFVQVTCDNEEWEIKIHEIHNNIAMRKYIRRYYKLEEFKYNDYLNDLDKEYVIEYVDVSILDKLNYENSDKIKNWFNFNDINKFKDYCLGSYIRKGNKILSWCLVDCIVDDKIEIGITTDNDYKRKGLGAIVVAATVNASMSKGISDIGWHCVDTNIGSIKTAEKVGFKKIKTYSCFTPFPPIENVTDLNKEQWTEWALYYEEMNKLKPNYYWLAAKCWAKASNMKNAIKNIKILAESGQVWFAQYFPHSEEFYPFKGDPEWEKLIKYLYDYMNINIE